MAQKPSISFITGTGRCGSVTLANILALSGSCLSMHEGAIQGGRESMTRPIPPLTKLNLQGYLNPDYAEEIIYHLRKLQIEEIFKKYEGINHFCEIAYYFAPFLKALYKIFPGSKLVIVVRDGRHFVWSAYSAEIPDRMPIGYVDEREFNKHETAVAAGRLRPQENTKTFERWKSYTPFQKNCWLWAETNQIIIEGIKSLPKEMLKIFRFENLFDSPGAIKSLLDFLGIEGIEDADIHEVLARKMNARKKRAIKHPDEWNRELTEQFDMIAGPMMEILGYY